MISLRNKLPLFLQNNCFSCKLVERLFNEHLWAHPLERSFPWSGEAAGEGSPRGILPECTLPDWWASFRQLTFYVRICLACASCLHQYIIKRGGGKGLRTLTCSCAAAFLAGSLYKCVLFLILHFFFIFFPPEKPFSCAVASFHFPNTHLFLRSCLAPLVLSSPFFPPKFSMVLSTNMNRKVTQRVCIVNTNGYCSWHLVNLSLSLVSWENIGPSGPVRALLHF